MFYSVYVLTKKVGSIVALLRLGISRSNLVVCAYRLSSLGQKEHRETSCPRNRFSPQTSRTCGACFAFASHCSISVIHPKCGPLALRLSAVLLLGITRIHNVLPASFFHFQRQCKYLLSDTNDIFGRVRFQSHPQAVNLPEDNSFLRFATFLSFIPRQERASLPVDSTHLQQGFLELHLTASQVRPLSPPHSQMGLNPILDTLNLEDGQLVIGEEGLEGVLQGMETPMSDIPVAPPPLVHSRRSPT